jgi:formylglycine-generating enzyme required for sulfatase activity
MLGVAIAMWCCACGSSSDSSSGGSAGTGGEAGTGASAGTGGSAGTTSDAATTADSDTDAGSCLDSIAWYADNASGKATAPGGKAPNAYGLYDMLGNTVEWVQDCYHETYTSSAPSDGSAWEEDTCDYRVIRGGCYGSTARGVRVSWRDGVKTSFYGACAPGVRCVRTSSTVPSTALINMQWVSIPAGTFTMGCSAGDDKCYDNESTPHSVTVGAFEMTAKEPTQQEYYDQMKDSPAATWCAACAETYVTWEEASAFCQALGGRLPTEAEWEYAARGGTATRYYCGNN